MTFFELRSCDDFIKTLRYAKVTTYFIYTFANGKF